MLKGLSDKTSVGRFGRFKENAGDRMFALNTCVINDVTLFTFGKYAKIIGEPAVGPAVRTRILRNTWCGRTVELATRGETQQIDFYTTLPGPLFRPEGKRWGFNFAVGSSFVDIESLPDGKKMHAWATLKKPPQVLLLHHNETPCLLLTSMRAQSLEIVTHEHWWFTFRDKGARIMIVPLLDLKDAPRTPALIRLWLDLLRRPPVRFEESFEYKNDAVTIVAQASSGTGGAVAACPVPPMAAMLGAGAFQRLDPAVKLLTGFNGPYAVVPGRSAYRRTIRMDWVRAQIEFTRPLRGRLSAIPRELVYAGDMSWDEKYPMDALLCLRAWAPLAGIIPDVLWRQIKRRIKLPTPKAFKKTLVRYVEPSVKRTWAVDKTLFKLWGEVSYDHDWYTGLTLSGMWRAASCRDPAISAGAKRLYTACRKERNDMVGYCAIFSDWAFDGAMSDPRGEGYDYDCSRNGIEGVLAEARMRETAGDLDGRDFCYYLAARFAVCFLAAHPLAELHHQKKWLCNPPENYPANEQDLFGLRYFRERLGAAASSARFKSWPPLFPEYCALLKKYGPVENLRRLTAIWERKMPERYTDWLAFYLGNDIAQKTRSNRENASINQECREQAAVFYHVAPDVMLRLWVLDQDPDRVERLYQTPMPLMEQVLCRAGTKLIAEKSRPREKEVVA